MIEIRYTLLSDGSSDRALLPILDWLLKQYVESCNIWPQWADLARLRNPPKSLTDRITQAVDLYPCNLLFVHRDAERESYEKRRAEIDYAIRQLPDRQTLPPYVCVVPVRMLEAWLLLDEHSIRSAAGNPRGRDTLDLPRLQDVEQFEDPKAVLFAALKKASGLRGGRRARFKAHARVQRIPQLIQDFSPLRTLEAFGQLDKQIREFAKTTSAAAKPL